MSGGQRDVLAEGTVRFTSPKCSIWVSRLRPGLVLVRIEGHDTGGVEPGPLDELQAEVARYGTLELFIDTRDTFNATPEVAERWTRWIGQNRLALKRVHVLVQSKPVQITVEVGKLFSRTGELMRIHKQQATFVDALSQVLGGSFDLDAHVARLSASASGGG